jgi:hypothetical protein
VWSPVAVARHFDSIIAQRATTPVQAMTTTRHRLREVAQAAVVLTRQLLRAVNDSEARVAEWREARDREEQMSHGGSGSTSTGRGSSTGGGGNKVGGGADRNSGSSGNSSRGNISGGGVHVDDGGAGFAGTSVHGRAAVRGGKRRKISENTAGALTATQIGEYI